MPESTLDRSDASVSRARRTGASEAELPRDAPGEKALFAVLVVVVWLVGYFAIAASVDVASAHSLRTPLDDAIPFVPESILGYSWVYSAMLLPLFTVRCHRLFRRIVIAYGLVLGVSFACFMIFPVTSLGFRPDDAALAALGADPFLIWGLRLNLRLDPPLNLFPSLHLSSITLVALSAGQARRGFGAFAGVIALVVAVSLLTVKQHFVADMLPALALGAAAWAAIVRPHRARGGARPLERDADEGRCARGGARPLERDGDEGRCARGGAGLAYGWRGPLAYLVFHAAAIFSLWIAFRLGLPPGPL